VSAGGGTGPGLFAPDNIILGLLRWVSHEGRSYPLQRAQLPLGNRAIPPQPGSVKVLVVDAALSRTAGFWASMWRISELTFNPGVRTLGKRGLIS